MTTDSGTEGDGPGGGTTPAIDALGYEKARDELAEVVRALEVGGLSLDDALALWERGERLARHCERQLNGARDRVDAVLAEAPDEKSGESSEP